MTQDRQHEALVAERAALWCSQLANADIGMRREFVQWLKQSPLHVREVLLATALDMELGRFDPERKYDVDEMFTRGANNVTPLMPEKRDAADEATAAADDVPAAGTHANENPPVAEMKSDSKPPCRKPFGWLIGVAAVASMIVLALSWPSIIKGVGLEQHYQTQTGEQRTIPLDDGSVIHLNTQSSVRVAFSEDARDVYLEDGQAAFEVAHDATRPFRVHARNAIVQAVGTQFDVNSQSEHVEVAVIEGRVKVTVEPTARSSATELSAGKGMKIDTSGAVSAPSDVKVSDVTAWRNRRLVFRNHTLSQIAAEFNRYNKTPKIRIEGALLQVKRYSGVFDANDPESFIDYLTSDHRLAFDHGDTQVVIRFHSSYASVPPAESRLQGRGPAGRSDAKVNATPATSR